MNSMRSDTHWTMSNKDRTISEDVNTNVITLQKGIIYIGEINSEGNPNGYGFKYIDETKKVIESYYENGKSFGKSRSI